MGQFNELCCRYYCILKSIPYDVQKKFYNNVIHTENDFIGKEGLSSITLLISLPIDSENYEQTFLEEL